MHDSIGIDSGISPIFAGIGIGIGIRDFNRVSFAFDKSKHSALFQISVLTTSHALLIRHLGETL